MAPSLLTFSGKSCHVVIFLHMLRCPHTWYLTPADEEMTWGNERRSCKAFCDLASEITRASSEFYWLETNH